MKNQSHLSSKHEILAHHRERRIFMQRLLVLRIACALLLITLAVRVGYLQIYQHQNFSTAADDNRIQLQPVAPRRGDITDYNGSTLATNRLVRSVFYSPLTLKDTPEALPYLATLLDINDLEMEQLHERLEKIQQLKTPILIKSDITDYQEAALMVRSHKLPGLIMRNSYERYYPYGASFSHTIGYMAYITKEFTQQPNFDPKRYIATAKFGVSGIEKRYEKLLQGYPGWENVEVDVHGKVRRVISSSQPKQGKRLRLGLDTQLQNLGLNLLGDRRGAVVAMEPQTGRLLVALSNPSFDPNLFVRGIDSASYKILVRRKDNPFFNRFSQGLYAPASTIKPFYALTLLKAKLINPHLKIYDHGFFQIEGDERVYRNWKRSGHGSVDLERAIRVSNDTYFFHLAHRLGYQPFVNSLREFGFGRKVSIDVLDEKTGHIPTPDWLKKRFNRSWYGGDAVNMSVGQGYVLSTPLQLVSATAIIANRGKVVAPRLLIEVDGKPVTGWEHLNPLADISADSNTWKYVISAMESVAHHKEGTAAWVGRKLPWRLAGKTGTAQLFTLQKDEEYDALNIHRSLQDNALFIGFAPVDNPQIAIAVIVENGGSGSVAAAPIAAKIIDAHLRLNVAELN